MNSGRTVFAQLLDFLPLQDFRQCVDRYRGNWRTRGFSCLDQMLAMMYAQLTYCDSLRDTITCLAAHSPKLYQCGFRGNISRSTLADANEHRDWRIYADLAAVLIAKARGLYANEGFGVALKRSIYAFDSTTIDLCLKLFPWAQFRRRKSAVKLHTLLDLRGNIPCFIHISSGRMTDMESLDLLPLEPGAFYIFDKGYNDFARLYRFTQEMAFFVTRAKGNLVYTRRSRRRVDKSTGIRSDQTIVLSGPKTSQRYPAPLRKIAYYSAEMDKRFMFLTNNFRLAPLTVAELYRRRWRVELFFKWIKQYLRIKSFYGTSTNAVKTQVWIAVCVYVLVAIIKKELKIDRRMGEILQILCACLFEKEPLLQVFSHTCARIDIDEDHNHLPLFDF